MIKQPRLFSLALALLSALPATAIAASPEPADQIAAAASPGQSQGMEISRAKDGMFYVQAEINGQKIRFLVDTGANVMVLNGADAAKLGIQAQADMFGPQMATAGGNAPMAWAKLDRVRLAGCEATDIKAAVVRSGLPVSLLGQNMLSKLASVTIEGDHLRMR